MKKTIITFILGGIFFSTITATAAYVYTARDISYTPQDENWSVTNADQALTSLKEDVDSLNQYRSDIVESLVDKGVNVNENSSMVDIKNGIDNMGATDVYYLGNNTTFDIKTLFPNDYQSFTSDNFIVETITGSIPSSSVNAKGTWDSSSLSGNSSLTVSKSYNAETGQLTVGSVLHHYSYISNQGYKINKDKELDKKVYLIIGNIENR